jgi:hypothetical protein
MVRAIYTFAQALYCHIRIFGKPVSTCRWRGRSFSSAPRRAASPRAGVTARPPIPQTTKLSGVHFVDAFSGLKPTAQLAELNASTPGCQPHDTQLPALCLAQQCVTRYADKSGGFRETENAIRAIKAKLIGEICHCSTPY